MDGAEAQDVWEAGWGHSLSLSAQELAPLGKGDVQQRASEKSPSTAAPGGGTLKTETLPSLEKGVLGAALGGGS